MQKQLIAAQTFLGGIRSLSTYELARDRQKKVACLTAGQAATFLQALGENLWASGGYEGSRAAATRAKAQATAEAKRHFYIVKMRHRVFEIILLHLVKLLLPIFHLLSKRIFIIVSLNVLVILRIPVLIVKGRSILPVAGTFG